MRNPPRTVQEAFKLEDDMQSQQQVVDSFKLELSNNFSPVEVNEMSAGETSGDEFEVNEMSRGKKWGNNNNYKRYNPNNNHNGRPQYNKPQDNETGKTWGQKGKDSKNTLMQESFYFVPAEFSDSFFKQFDLAMRIKREELKKQDKSSTQVNEITKRYMIQAFGIIEDQMEKAADILGKDKKTDKLGNSSF